jgi:tetratricopeptide (TPR) repeat protein
MGKGEREGVSEEIAVLLERAFDRLRLGKVAEALSLSEGLLSREPGHAGALHLAGLGAMMAGRKAEGRARLEEAALRAPDDAEIWRNLGTARLGDGDEDGAIEALSHAVTLRPGYQGAAMALAGLFQRRGALAEAAAVLEPFPGSAEASRVRAALFNAMGAHGDALDMADRCLALEGEAVPVTLVNRGQALLGLGRSGEAAELFRHALALDPGHWPARLGLSAALARSGNWMAAARAFGANVEEFPALALAADSLPPPVPGSTGDIDEARNRLRDRLADLRSKAAFIPDPNALVGGLAHPQLAAHGRDDTALLSEIADTLRTICPVLCHLSEKADSPEPAKDGRRRVGVLSHRLVRGEGGLQAGLVEGLMGRADLEITLFAPDYPAGPLWERLASKADKAVILPRDILRSQRLIEAERLEVMLYPDLGNDDFTMALAHGRQAPVQCALAGHPMTTGLPSIDWMIVGEMLEGAGAQAFYRERLARLPGFLAHVPRPQAEEADRARLNLPDNATLYLCGQRLSKIHPDMDGLFARILKEDPKGHLCLFRDADPGLTTRMAERLSAAGLPKDRVLWLKRARRGIYLAALGAVDLALDTLHWGAGLTAFETLAMGTPLVTLQGNTLRTRRAAGLLKVLGVADTVARTEDAYVRLAVELGKSASKRRDLSARLRAAAPLLFEDRASVEALAAFLVKARKPD